MKTFKIISITAIISLILGAVLFHYYGPKTKVIETVDRIVSSVPQDVESILKDNPDIEQAVRDEARKRQIRENIASLQNNIDTLTAELVELEGKGFTQAFTPGTN